MLLSWIAVPLSSNTTIRSQNLSWCGYALRYIATTPGYMSSSDTFVAHSATRERVIPMILPPKPWALS
jgi:hypothetical protein